VAVSAESIAVTVVAGLVVGVLAALFGVGGGLLMVPFIVLFLDQGQHLAEGTSLAVIVPTAIVGVVAHSKRGYVSMSSAAWMAIGGIAGAVVGARLALATPAAVLETVFGAFVLAIGIRFVWQGLRKAREAGPR
jgi:uncharacterized membrane protein YfcA